MNDREKLVERTKHENRSLDAVCTWGDGPDILLMFDGYPFFNLEPIINYHSVHGVGIKGSISLDRDEADKLRQRLVDSIAQVDKLNQLCEEHDRWEENVRISKVSKDIPYSK